MRKSLELFLSEDFGLSEKDGSVHDKPTFQVVVWNCGPQMSLSTVLVDPASWGHADC